MFVIQNVAKIFSHFMKKSFDNIKIFSNVFVTEPGVKASEEIKQKKCLKSSSGGRKIMRRKKLRWKASYIVELLMAVMA